MSVVILYHFAAVCVLFLLWFLLSRWVRSRGQSQKVKDLRRNGEFLLQNNASMPNDVAIAEAERLLASAELIVSAACDGESPPLLVGQLPAWPRSVFLRFSSIRFTSSSLELGWRLFVAVDQRRIRIGRSNELGIDVLIDLDSGTVTIGRDVFISLAHLFVFQMD